MLSGARQGGKQDGAGENQSKDVASGSRLTQGAREPSHQGMHSARDGLGQALAAGWAGRWAPGRVNLRALGQDREEEQ